MQDVDPEADPDEDDDSNVIESCAFGLIYALGVLSFADARPRGRLGHALPREGRVAGWRHAPSPPVRARPAPLLRRYVRGRCLKTTIEIDWDGKITLETVNRGEAATRWVAKLQGKKVIGLG